MGTLEELGLKGGKVGKVGKVMGAEWEVRKSLEAEMAGGGPYGLALTKQWAEKIRRAGGR